MIKEFYMLNCNIEYELNFDELSITQCTCSSLIYTYLYRLNMLHIHLIVFMMHHNWDNSIF